MHFAPQSHLLTYHRNNQARCLFTSGLRNYVW